MKKLNLKTKVWHKYALSFGIVAIASAISISAIYAYAKNSPDKLGRENPTNPLFLTNEFAASNKEAKLQFVSGNKSSVLGTWDHQNDQVTYYNSKNEEFKVSSEEFLKIYYKTNKHYPILNIRYGSFDFFNEYLEAVPAKAFKEFTDWFMTNVSWGPEIVTLKEFSIVKGVEMRGNSITLGSHSDNNKEYMTIKFFPDAFFGTLAAYSEIGGRGNQRDSLMYKLNKKLLNAQEVNDFLRNIANYNIVANSSEAEQKLYSFRDIVDFRSLVNKKVWVAEFSNWDNDFKKQSLHEYETNRYSLTNSNFIVLHGNTEKEAKASLDVITKIYEKNDSLNFLSKLQNVKLVQKTISSLKIKKVEVNKKEVSDSYLNINFSDGTDFNLFKSFEEIDFEFSPNSFHPLENAHKLSNSNDLTKDLLEREIARLRDSKNFVTESLKNHESELKLLQPEFEKTVQKITNNIKAKTGELNSLKSDPNKNKDAISKIENEIKILESDLSDEARFLEKSKISLFEKITLYRTEAAKLEIDLFNYNKGYKDLESNEKITKETELAALYTKRYQISREIQGKLIDTYKRLSLTDPISDDDFLLDDFVVYNYDLAYLPNQIFTNKFLKSMAQLNYLNWRDFYNIYGFVQKNKNKKVDDKAFFIYSKHFESLSNLFNKKYPNSTFKNDYTNILTTYNKLKNDAEINAKKLSEIDKKREEIFALFNESFSKEVSKDNKKEIIPGTNYISQFSFSNSKNGQENIFKLNSDFDKFLDENFTNLSTFFNDTKKRWDTFYSTSQAFVKKYDTEIKDADKWINALANINKLVAADPSALQNDLLVKRLKGLEKNVADSKSKWESHKNEAGFIDFGQWKALETVNTAFPQAIKLSLEIEKAKDEFKTNKVNKLFIDVQAKFNQFKLEYLTQTINPQDPKLLVLYNKYLAEFNKNLNNLNEQIKNKETLREQYNAKKHELVLYKIINSEKLNDDNVKNEITKKEAEINKTFNDYSTLSNQLLFNSAILSDDYLEKSSGNLANIVKEIRKINNELILNESSLAKTSELNKSLNNLNGKLNTLVKRVEKNNNDNGIKQHQELLDLLFKQFNNEYQNYKNLANKVVINNQTISEMAKAIKISASSDEISKLVVELKEKNTEYNKFVTETLNASLDNSIKMLNGLKKQIKDQIQKAKLIYDKGDLVKQELFKELENINSTFSKLTLNKVSESQLKIKEISELSNLLSKSLQDSNEYEININQNITKFNEIDQFVFSKTNLADNSNINNLNKTFSSYFNTLKAIDNKLYLSHVLESLSSNQLTFYSTFRLQEINWKIQDVNRKISLLKTDQKDYNAAKKELDINLKSLQDQLKETEKKIAELETKNKKDLEEYNKVLATKTDEQKANIKNSLKTAFTSIDAHNKLQNKFDLSFAKQVEFLKLLDSKIASKDHLITKYQNSLKLALDLSLKVNTKTLINQNKDQLLNDINYLGFELKSQSDILVAKTKTELRELLLKNKIINAKTPDHEIEKLIKTVALDNISKNKSKLLVTIREIAKENEQVQPYTDIYNDQFLKFNIDAKSSYDSLSAFDNLLNIFGYKKVLAPRMVREEGDIVDPSTGKISKGYAIYADGYQNLMNDILHKVPEAAQWLFGDHLAEVVDPETGKMTYQMQNGPYLGFSKDHRVGLWAVLKATDPNFSGIAIDFLKFVAAHEYGHHMTLNGAKNLGDKAPGNNSIFVSALTPGATPGVSNYYNRDALRMYLEARTNLALNTRTYLNGKFVLKEDGEYPVFMYPKLVKRDGKEVIEYVEEDEKDIWGSELSETSIEKAISNSSRRFIQDFEGMKKALELRRKALNLTDKNKDKISMFDIWLPNAMDTYSGTLNPTVEGIAKYLIFDKTENKYKFLPGSLKMLEGILKDGQGNNIIFEEVNGQILPKVADFEYKKEGNNESLVIKKVHIFNKDNTPIISAPLNINLYSSEAEK
ncbi:PDxFFG protein, partial [Mycoplasmopsis alligatoris]